MIRHGIEWMKVGKLWYILRSHNRTVGECGVSQKNLSKQGFLEVMRDEGEIYG